MKRQILSTIFALAAGLAAAALVTGCAPGKRVAGAKSQTHAYTEGVMCPNCETVWVRERNRYGPRNVIRLGYSRETTCPDCDAMARSRLLEDGKVMLHECPTCKITPKPILSNETGPPGEPRG